MAIDKIIPFTLNKSSDERAVKSTEMTDALNVTVSTDEDGNGFVLKTAKGNVPISGTLPAANRQRKVIGSVTDLDTDYVYFFVAHPGTGGSAILRCNYNRESPEYEEVYSEVADILDLQVDSYVDADILRVDTNQAGTVQTIIYFTDGVNEPRKINVDRALSGILDSYSNDDIREFFSVCKTAPRDEIVVYSATDDHTDKNSIYGKSFSFAYQYVYKDGEESALSNHSNPVVPDYLLNTVYDDGKPIHSENVIKVEVPHGGQEVDSVNIIFRDLESGVFYKAGNFSFSSNKPASQVDGRDFWDYDEGGTSPAVGVFHFYNSQAYPAMAEIDAFKMFDNVPQKSNAQTISNGRLFYGGYEEGYPNHSTNANFLVEYSDVKTLDYRINVTNKNLSTPGDYDIILDFSNCPQTLYKGESLSLDFSIDTNGQWSVYLDDPVVGTATPQPIDYLLNLIGGSDPDLDLGGTSDTALRFNSKVFKIKTSYEVTQSSISTPQAVVSMLNNIRFNSGQQSYGLRFDYNDSNPPVSGDETPAVSPVSDSIKIKKATISLGFTVGSYHTPSSSIPIRPYVTNVVVGQDPGDVLWYKSSLGEYVNYDLTSQSYNLNNSGGANDTMADYVDTISNSNDDYELGNSNKSLFSGDLERSKTWKAGVNHDFGIVYYDERGRNGFVNELGSVYVKHISEREKRGRAEIKLNLKGLTHPSWATDFGIVYGGNQDILDFKQYSVADGFSSYYYDASYSETQGEEHDNRIYVSLKSWSGSRISYVGDKGVDYNYKFKQGDVLRILKYKDDSGDYVYPDNLEFKVVDFRHLREDIEDETAESLRAEIREIEEGERSGFGDFVMNALNRITGGEEDPNSFIGGSEDQSEAINELIEELRINEYKRLRTHPISLRNPLIRGNYAPCKGHFLVLEDPGHAGWGAADRATNSNGGVAHVVPGDEYDSGSSPGHTADSAHFHPIINWSRHVVVEIYTPKIKAPSKKVYREINKTFSVDEIPTSADSIVNLGGGDVWYKNTPIRVSEYDEAHIIDDTHSNLDIDARFKARFLNGYDYENQFIESQDASHYYSSPANFFGRSIAVNKDAATNKRRHSITYSDRFNSDSPVLRLSDFNLSLANYMDLSFRYGLIDKLIDGGGHIFCLQDSKVCKIPIGKNVVNYTDGSQNVTISKNVMGEPGYYMGDYGSSGNKGSVVSAEGKVFFLDVNARKVFRLSNDGLTDISSKTIDSFLVGELDKVQRSLYDAGGTAPDGVFPRIVGGWDPDYGQYLLTVGDYSYYSDRASGLINVDGFTLAYQDSLKSWVSQYSFVPDCYGCVGDNLISAKHINATSSILWAHADELIRQGVNIDTIQRANYYNDQEDSIIEVVANKEPSMVKVFEAIGLETTSDNFDVNFSTSDQSSSLTKDDFNEKERGKYAEIPRDTTVSNDNANQIVLGKVLSNSAGDEVTFASNINFQPIPKGASVYVNGSDTGETVNKVSGRNKLKLSAAYTVVADDVVKIVLDAATNGDPLRDYFCKVKLTNQNDADTNGKWELYGINLNTQRSNLGQEVRLPKKVNKKK